ncbi:MAG: SulP family inorganic anion transporter [Candidatus Sericytochromatia bacterium]
MFQDRIREEFTPKLFTLIKEGLSLKQIKKDILAGIIVGIVALPLAIAFAIASGVSPEKGLITAIFTGFIISALGGSRVQIGGPTGAFIVIVYGIIQKYNVEGLIIATFIAGFILILLGIFRVGNSLKYIPHSLIVGFTSGIALTIFSTQIKDFFGLKIEKVPSEFLEKWLVYFEKINTLNYYALFISILSVLTILYYPKIVKKISFIKFLVSIPSPLISIILCTFIAYFFDLPVETIQTKFGEIPSNIPYPKIPHLDWEIIKHSIAPAFTIALLGGIESLLSASVADSMIGGRHRPNIELIAQGLANMCSSIFGGIPATGAIARTATNVKNGGRTPIAGMTHAITLLLIMLVASPVAKMIPLSCLAGVLVVIAYNMSEIDSFISIFNSNKYDRSVLLTVFFLTVIFDLVIAIQVGVFLSFFLFVRKISKMSNIEVLDKRNISEKLFDTEFPHLKEDIMIFELSGAFFFASSNIIQKTLREINKNPKYIIFNLRRVPVIDETAIYELEKAIEKLNKNNTQVFITGFNENIEKELLKMKINEISIMKSDIKEVLEQLN